MKRITLFFVFGILTVSLGASLAYAIEASTPAPAAAAVSTSSTTIIMPESVKIDMESKFFYDSKGKSDPMDLPWEGKEALTAAPGTGEKPAEVEIDPLTIIKPEVKGVVYCKEKPSTSMVIIGESILKAGQTATLKGLPKAVKVIKIEPNVVTVSYISKTYKIKIVNESYF
jgi:hypothetical protein